MIYCVVKGLPLIYTYLRKCPEHSLSIYALQLHKNSYLKVNKKEKKMKMKTNNDDEATRFSYGHFFGLK